MMLSHFINRTMSKHLYSFSTFNSAHNYYNVLGVESAATTQQIRQAYAKLTKSISANTDATSLKKLSEAFVILTDLQARNAYDSLLKSRKTQYMREPAVQTIKNQSYLTQRKRQKREQFEKKYNLDKFGRYRGGLPNRKSTVRGKSLGEIGDLHLKEDIEFEERFPDYDAIDQETAQSFKDFHQNQRQSRTKRWPRFQFEIDYDYFSLRRFRGVWRFTKYILTIFLIIPVFASKLAEIAGWTGSIALFSKQKSKQIKENAKKTIVLDRNQDIRQTINDNL